MTPTTEAQHMPRYSFIDSVDESGNKVFDLIEEPDEDTTYYVAEITNKIDAEYLARKLNGYESLKAQRDMLAKSLAIVDSKLRRDNPYKPVDREIKPTWFEIKDIVEAALAQVPND